MRRILALGLVMACGKESPPAADAEVQPDASGGFDPLVGAGNAELVDGGYQFVEGPQWRETEQDLLFSDIPANTIFRYVPGGAAPTVFRMPSGNSNGLAVDGNGSVLAAEHGSRSITRGGTLVVGTFENNSLNSPNDVIAAGDTIYFTDPPFGIDDNQRELDFIGVFRFANGMLTAEHRGTLAERPNGIGISPDGSRLYVTDTNDGNLYRFPIESDGSLGARELHAVTAGTPDGLAIDTGGNVFVAAAGGVDVFSPDGSRWGQITLPEVPANCAFGDADHKSLYITARTGLYRVRLRHAGLPTH